MSTGKSIVANPARDFAEAERRFAELAARDGARIIPEGRSRFASCGHRTPLAVVLLHGFTNVPEQWRVFADGLLARGHNVVIPRLPGHGDVDRRGRELARVRADDFLEVVSLATDVAAGAGERVVVAGLSIGGAMAAWIAQRRADVARGVAIVPLFGLARANPPLDRALATLLGVLPNVFVPWDPRKTPGETPPYAYPDFPTRTLAQCMRVGLDVYDTAPDRPPAGDVAMLLNAREPACDNAMSFEVARRFVAARPGSCRTSVMDDLPANHDVIDPTNPQARTGIVYPRVLALIEGDD